MVFNDVFLLSTFKRWVAHSPMKQNLFLAKDALKAIEILNSTPIDLLITSFKLAEMDGLELIAEVSYHYSNVKIAFFLPAHALINHKLLTELTSLYFIIKPSSLKELILFIDVNCLTVAETQAIPICDVIIGDFLQLIEYQKKTCMLEIKNVVTQQKTVVYFNAGILFDAVASEENHASFAGTIALQSYLSVNLTQVCAEFNSSALMTALLTWKQVKMQFKLFDSKTVQRTLHVSIADLLNGKT